MESTMSTFQITEPSGGHANPKDYESKKELAARLGVSVRTIDNLLKRGLPAS